MDWQIALLLIIGSLIAVMLTGLPVAFCFMLISLVGSCFFLGGMAGLEQMIRNIYSSLTLFTLLPMPLFILMGYVLYHSSMAPLMINAIDKWLGRLPGRLALLSVAAGVLLSTLTGASMASVAMLGKALVPDMEKRGYKRAMSLGPILGSGGLAIMIPPSGLVIFVGVIAEVSIGKLLMAVIIPGILMAILYAAYIIVRCILQPSLAPSYAVPKIPLSEKLLEATLYILPVGFIIFMVIGVILLGITTPTEAAATGAFGTVLLAAMYRKLSWRVLKESFSDTLEVVVMIFMIVAAATTFTQILAISGASQGFINYALDLPLPPIIKIVNMQIIVLLLGMFMGAGSLIMIAIPIFMPIVNALGYDPIWFSVLFLLNLEMGTTTPPFGLSLFVMKGVVAPDTTMKEIYYGALPFLYCDLIAMILIFIFPMLALWLPSVAS